MKEMKEMKDGNVNMTVTFPKDSATKLFSELKEIMGLEILDMSNLPIIVLNLMQVVDTYKNLSGAQKKAIVLDALTRLIEETIDDDTVKGVLNSVVKFTIPPMMDKNPVYIIKKIKGYFSCCS